MNDEIRTNLTASLRSTTTELSEVARDLPDLNTDKEIEQHAEILDHIADSARGGAAILRAALAARRRARPPLPRRIRRDVSNAHRISPEPGGNAS
ncbi:MAG TPA: hypothetical protein VGH77_10025 [Streptosporangiaceae bacterium]|jgi:hypothetical protein